MCVSVCLCVRELLLDQWTESRQMCTDHRGCIRECIEKFWWPYVQNQGLQRSKGQQRLYSQYRRNRVRHITDMRLYIFVDSSNCYSLTFLAIKALIFIAQKVITYHWKGNRITNVLSTINGHLSDDLNVKNGKNWILGKSDVSNISDKRAFQIVGI